LATRRRLILTLEPLAEETPLFDQTFTPRHADQKPAASLQAKVAEAMIKA
jgi:hypothetical protein